MTITQLWDGFLHLRLPWWAWLCLGAWVLGIVTTMFGRTTS